MLKKTLRKRWNAGEHWRVEFAHPNYIEELVALARQYPNHEVVGDIHEYKEFYSIDFEKEKENHG
jgi:hypothetical protein